MLDHKPLISVIITVYNSEKYVSESINSVLNQTYKNIEIIIVNDGSVDGSLKILQDYQSRYPDKIKVVSQENKGLAGALNTGLRIMRGKYYKKLDSDDVFYPNCIEIFVNAAESMGEECIIYANSDYIDVDGNFVERYTHKDFNNINEKSRNIILFLKGLRGTMGFDFISKKLLDRYGLYDESIIVNEDYEMQLRYCVLYGVKLHRIPFHVAKIRLRPNSLTMRNPYRAERQDEITRQNILKQLNKEDRKYYQKEIKKAYRQLPFRLQFRRFYQTVMISLLGISTTEKILKFYMNIRYG